MNIDELKNAWNDYDKKVEATKRFHENLIESMIANRSGDRFSKIKRNYLLGFLWMFGWAALALLICLTNPFDYEKSWQYIPLWIFIGCVVVFIVGMIRTVTEFNSISITNNNVGSSLKKIIEVYERPQKFQKYTLWLFLFSQVILFPLSFLPRAIERAGVWPALAERLIPMAIAALMLYAAHKLGAFKERHKDKLKEDLSELEELKRMSDELAISNE